MKITTITYRRVKNLGNYESEALEVTATLDEDIDENPVDVYYQLQEWVFNRLDIRRPPTPEPELDIDEIKF